MREKTAIREADSGREATAKLAGVSRRLSVRRRRSLSDQEKMSPIVRVASGVIGVLGFVAIAFNAASDGGLHLGVMTLASFFAGFIFLFAAFFGKYPWDRKKTEDSDN